MKHIELTIAAYLNTLAEVHGHAYSQQTRIRHTGGSDVVVSYPDGHKSIVSIGRLRLMSEQLKNQARIIAA